MTDKVTKIKEEAVVDFANSQPSTKKEDTSIDKGDTSYWLEVNPAIKDHDAKYRQEKKIEFLIRQELLNRYKG